MQTKELKELYTVREFYADDGSKFYVLPGEMAAIDAVKLVASKLHIGKDKVNIKNGFVGGNFLYIPKPEETAPEGAADVWAMTVRR